MWLLGDWLLEVLSATGCAWRQGVLRQVIDPATVGF